MTTRRYFALDRSPGRWTVTFANPPINMIGPSAIAEFAELVAEGEADQDLKVVVFQSADPAFFIAHYDTNEAPPAGGGPSWATAVERLARAPYVSIAKIRGRARGIGSEFALACDLRFAARPGAVLANIEVGVGLPPGGGALEWLPRLAGRSRALEILLSGEDFDADLAERYGWINRAVDEADLDAFVERLACRVASFDRLAIATIKAQVNRYGVPTVAEIEASTALFRQALAWPAAQPRRERLRTLGNARTDFELRFGERLMELGL